MRKKNIRKNEFYHLKPYAFSIEDFKPPPTNYLSYEFGCGDGQFLSFLAERHPDRFYAGFDMKTERLWQGCKRCSNENIHNIAFVYSPIQLINEHLPSQKADEVWLLFSDPHSKPSKAKKRLTHSFFQEKYSQVMKKNALIHFKTDDPDLFEFSQEAFSQSSFFDITETIENIKYSYDREDYYVPTRYELVWTARKRPIYYLRARKQ